MKKNSSSKWMEFESGIKSFCIVGIAVFILLVIVVFNGCVRDPFVGPATKAPECQQFCAYTNKCCLYDEVCSRYLDRPCAAPELMGMSNNDGGFSKVK